MKCICTAPCIPACTEEAEYTLLNSKSKSVLGQNCKHHTESLTEKEDSDYSKELLKTE